MKDRELIAVFALVLGLYVRTISLLLLVILVPALKLWMPNGIWAIHGGYEFLLMWILMQLTLAMLGPRAASEDYAEGEPLTPSPQLSLEVHERCCVYHCLKTTS